MSEGAKDFWVFVGAILLIINLAMGTVFFWLALAHWLGVRG